jgi:predicted nucleotidyltransferase
MVFQELLKRLARALEAAALPYMVIGDQAVLVHGEPRFTRDIDITLGVGPDALAILKTLASQMNLSILKDDDAFVQQTFVLPLRDDASGLRIDFIFSFSPYERQAIEHAVVIDIDGVPVRFASVEDLIVHKIVAGRARDLEDVRILLLKNDTVDHTYIESWLSQFDASLESHSREVFRNLLAETKG